MFNYPHDITRDTDPYTLVNIFIYLENIGSIDLHALNSNHLSVYLNLLGSEGIVLCGDKMFTIIYLKSVELLDGFNMYVYTNIPEDTNLIKSPKNSSELTYVDLIKDVENSIEYLNVRTHSDLLKHPNLTLLPYSDFMKNMNPSLLKSQIHTNPLRYSYIPIRLFFESSDAFVMFYFEGKST